MPTGKLVAAAPKEEKAALIAKGHQMAAGCKDPEASANQADTELMLVLNKIENVIIDGVPARVAKTTSFCSEAVRQFDFVPATTLQLGVDPDVTDIERGVKISWPRFYF